MSQASGGKYSFKWVNENGIKGLNVYKSGKRGELEKQNETPISEIIDLQIYFPSKGVNWESDIKKMRSQKKVSSNTYSSAQEANIKATLKANPGATRQQAIEALGY
jgi:hypothetical protein